LGCSVSFWASPFKSKLRLEAENAVLRRPVDYREAQAAWSRPAHKHDRWFLIQLYRWFPSILRLSLSSGPRRSCVGTGPAFLVTGVASRAHWEATADRHRAARVDPADEHGKSALGCAAHPRRTAGFDGAEQQLVAPAAVAHWFDGVDDQNRHNL